LTKLAKKKTHKQNQMGQQSAKPLTIFVGGLDAAGKTTLIYKIADPIEYWHSMSLPDTRPRTYKGHTLYEFDLPEKFSPDMRGYFGKYYMPVLLQILPQLNAIVWVVDGNDQSRVQESIDTLQNLRHFQGHEYLLKLPILFMLNKSDLKSFGSVTEVISTLNLEQLTSEGVQVHIQQTCATNGEGIYEGFDWLEQVLKQ